MELILFVYTFMSTVRQTVDLSDITDINLKYGTQMGTWLLKNVISRECHKVCLRPKVVIRSAILID